MNYEWSQEKARQKRALKLWLALIVIAAMVMAVRLILL